MRPEESLCEYRMIFVSIRFPEEIPWFKALRRAVVGAMSAGAKVSDIRYEPYLYDAMDTSKLKNRPKRTEIV